MKTTYQINSMVKKSYQAAAASGSMKWRISVAPAWQGIEEMASA